MTNRPDTGELQVRLKAFITSLDRDRLVVAASAADGGAPDEYAKQIDTYLGEAAVALDLVGPTLSREPRLLEVGCGIGVLTAFLKAEGFDIIGIEPGAAGGFGFMPSMHAAIAEQLPADERPTILPIRAEALNLERHGAFDVVFSANVIEHIMALEEAMAAMSSVLTPNGMMRHLCPNYHFPFEPHLGIPLMPCAPKLTRFVLPAVIKRNQRIWDTVNFVTASRLGRLARQNGLKMRMESGVMAGFFARLRRDPIFAERHSGFIKNIAATPLLGKLIEGTMRILPSALATPMIADLSHRKLP